MKRVGPGVIVIVLLTALAYSPVFRAGYLWDDDTALTENPQVRAADGLRDIWFSTKPYDYFPLTFTTFWLEWRLWGANPLGYHLVNVALHALGAALFWRVLLQLRVPGAWAAALIFAVHPVAVASVAWVAERKNTLSLVFFLLSALWYLRFDAARRAVAGGARPPWRRSPAWFYSLSLFAFLLALLGKTSVVTLPLVLALCEWWQGRAAATAAEPARRQAPQHKDHGRRSAPGAATAAETQMQWQRLRAAWHGVRPTLLRLAPFFALALALGLVTVWFQTHRAMTGNVYQRDDFLTRVLGGGWALWFYLGKSLLPVRLSMIYPRWEIEPGWLPAWLPGLLWLGLLWVCWRARRRAWGAALWFALASFTALLLPVLGFFEMAFFAHSRVGDHLQYLALLPVVAVATGAIGAWAQRRLGAFGAGALATVVVSVLAWQTWERARVFQGPESLWRDTVAKNPRAWAAWNNLGMATRDAREEFTCYTTALELNPNYADAHNNLGVLLYQQRRAAEAEMHLREAVRLQPLLAPAHNNLGSVLSDAGRFDEALRHLRRAVELNPNYVDAWVNLGLALSRHGEPAAAISCFERALQLWPDQPKPHLHWGNAAFQLQRYDEARAQYAAVLKLDPNHVEARHNLALALLMLGRTNDAVAQFQTVLTLRPDFVPAQYQLADIALAAGRVDEAVQRMATALELQPGVAELHELLGRARLAQNQSAEGLRHLREAARLRPDWPQALATLAWALATEPDEALRDGEEALRLATRAKELTGGTNLLALDALAAALAASGRFDEATRTAQAALAVARTSGDSNRVVELEARAALYQSGRPYRRERAGAAQP